MDDTDPTAYSALSIDRKRGMNWLLFLDFNILGCWCFMPSGCDNNNWQHMKMKTKLKMRSSPWHSIFGTGHIFALIITIFINGIIITKKAISIRWLIAVTLMIFRQKCIDAKGFFRLNICLIWSYCIGKCLLIAANWFIHESGSMLIWWRHCSWWIWWWWQGIGILLHHHRRIWIILQWFWWMHFVWTQWIRTWWHL